jgi:hypothetical protein
MAPQTGRGPNDIDEDVPFEGGDQTAAIKGGWAQDLEPQDVICYETVTTLTSCAETISLKRTREGSVVSGREPPSCHGAIRVVRMHQ